MLQYQTGQTGGIEVIFQRYRLRILNFSLRLLGNRADAEDVTGEVFLALFSRKYSYSPEAKFSTWLFTVARNSCISRLRKRKHWVSLWFTSKGTEKDEPWEIPDETHLSREELVEKERARYVRDSIAKLPEEQREALVLREYHDFSYDEISHILDCSLEKVKVLIFRARNQLRDELASFIQEEQS